jgi:hypothetical protein
MAPIDPTSWVPITYLATAYKRVEALCEAIKAKHSVSDRKRDGMLCRHGTMLFVPARKPRRVGPKEAANNCSAARGAVACDRCPRCSNGDLAGRPINPHGNECQDQEQRNKYRSVLHCESRSDGFTRTGRRAPFKTSMNHALARRPPCRRALPA